MKSFDADMVTIERAAEHLNISVEDALALAERYQSISREKRKETTTYSLTGFVTTHLQEATNQYREHQMRGVSRLAGNSSVSADANDGDERGRMLRQR